MTETPVTAERPQIDALAVALAAFQAEMPTVPKSHTAQVKSDKGSYSYTYAGLADVTESAMPLLAKNGLSFTTLPGNGTLTGMLLHSSGQFLTASLPISGNTPQAVGSSLTYMRRYLLGCMTGLVTDDDDDAQITSVPARRKPERPAATGETRTISRARPAPVEPPEPEFGAPPIRTDEGDVPAAESDPDAVTPAQITKIGTAMSKAKMTDRTVALAYVARVIGHEVQSRNELTKAEAHQVIEALEFDAMPEPVEATS